MQRILTHNIGLVKGAKLGKIFAEVAYENLRVHNADKVCTQTKRLMARMLTAKILQAPRKYFAS